MEKDKGKINRQKIYPALLILFFILIIVNNAVWISKDVGTPVREDVNWHIIHSRDYQGFLKTKRITEFFLPPVKIYYPQLIYQYTALAFTLFGSSVPVASFSLSFFWLLLILSCYELGSMLWSDKAGMLAGIASFSFPFMIFLSQRFYLDVPLTAVCAFLMLALIKSEKFENRGWTWAFFISLGVALMIKTVILIYVFVPFMITAGLFVRMIWDEQKERKWFFILFAVFALLISSLLLWRISMGKIADNSTVLRTYLISLAPLFLFFLGLKFKPPAEKTGRFFAGMAATAILCWHFYFIKFADVWQVFFGKVELGSSVNQPKTAWFFLRLFALGYLGIPLTMMFITGITWYIFSRDKNTDRNIIALGPLLPVVFVFFYPEVDPRYFLPITPFVAVIATFWIPQVKIKAIRSGVYILFGISVLMGVFGWVPSYSGLVEDKPLDKSVSYLGSYPFIPSPPRVMSERGGRALKRLVTVLQKNFSSGQMSIVFHEKYKRPADGIIHRDVQWFFYKKTGVVLQPVEIDRETVIGGYRVNSYTAGDFTAPGTVYGLSAIHGSADDNIIAVGEGGTIIRYDGKGWKKTESGTGAELFDVWTADKRTAYAVGENGLILKYDGKIWVKEPSPVESDLEAVAVGEDGTALAAGTGGVILIRTDRWEKIKNTVSKKDLFGVIAVDKKTTYAVGSGGVIVKYENGVTTVMPTPTDEDLFGIAKAGDDVLWAVGGKGTVLKMKNNVWEKVECPVNIDLKAIWSSSGSDVYFAGSMGTILYYDGSKFKTIRVGDERDLKSIWGVSGGRVFAVGENSPLMVKDGNRWMDWEDQGERTVMVVVFSPVDAPIGLPVSLEKKLLPDDKPTLWNVVSRISLGKGKEIRVLKMIDKDPLEKLQDYER